MSSHQPRLVRLTQNRDEAQWSKLQNLGMTLADEAKLVAMRDYTLKLANNASRYVPLHARAIECSPELS